MICRQSAEKGCRCTELPAVVFKSLKNVPRIALYFYYIPQFGIII